MNRRFASTRIWPLLALLIAAADIGSTATYQVGSIADLNAKISIAVAGDTIIVSNGVYTTTASIGVSRAGTAANPILIQAQTVGGAEITGSSGFSFNSGASYVTVQGFKFTHSNSISMGSSANHCRLTRNFIELKINPTNDVSYINISGDDMQVDYNELRNKSTLGEMLDIAGSGSQVARRLWVHHNYFHDFTSPGGNGAETIRWGLSGLSLSTGGGICEYNLFVRCEGENEMISNKSSGNTYRYNTVLDCVGGEISQRHGNDCLYYGNYMRNTQGMRVYGDRHKIFANYFESNSIGVNMGNGDGDVYAGDPLTSHDRPDNNIVEFNAFIANGTHYEMGGRTGGLGSSNTVVANNIFLNGGSIASISTTAPYTGTYTNNIRWNTSSTGNMPASGYTNVNPLLAVDANGILHLASNSPAINAGRAASDFYGALVSNTNFPVDMDGQPRDANPDTGADEFSIAPITAKFLTTNDVGPNSVANGFSLNVSPASRTVIAGITTNVTYTVMVTSLGGTNVVMLSVAGLPANAIAKFTPATVTNSGTSVLSVGTAVSTPNGNFSLLVSGVASGLTNTAIAGLSITTNAGGSGPLVAWLNFDDGSADDSSGYGNHGILMNGAFVTNDATRGKVLFLDGADDYVDLGNAASLDLSGVNQATVCAWLKVALSHSHNTVLSKGEWKEGYSLLVKGDSSPKDQLWTGNDTSVFSVAPVLTNAWAHVAMVINNNLTSFYLNGQLAGSTNQNRGGAIDYTTNGVCLGREQYSGALPAGRWFFNGRMDDVRIYQSALTQSDIRAIVAATQPFPPSVTNVAFVGGQLVLAGTNCVAGLTFSVLAGTNLLSPLNQWTVAASGQVDGNGNFSAAVPVDSSAAQRFFIIQVP